MRYLKMPKFRVSECSVPVMAFLTSKKIMKKNTLFLSGRQEGKTTFGLYSLYRYIMDTDEKTSVFMSLRPWPV